MQAFYADLSVENRMTWQKDWSKKAVRIGVDGGSSNLTRWREVK
jgi:hypothetical protein